MVDQIFSPSDYNYVMNDLKDGANLEDISVGQLLEPLQVYNNNEQTTYDMVPYEPKPAAKKRKTMNSKVCDSTMNPVPSTSINNVEALPCLTEFSGQFDFQLYLPNEVCAPHRWTYSPLLKKVFIDIEKVLALQFKWNYYELKQDVQLYIRALPVYTSPDWMKDPVLRCPLHILPDNSTNLGFPYVEHIIRCEHSSTRYERDEYTGRYSCVTPLSYPQPGSDTTTLTYKFVCKTSCPSGMDRKPISVVYTLEDVKGVVYGRQPLAVKICSCPKRDKAKEEEQIENEKKVTPRNPRSRTTGGSMSVRASKTPNNEHLKDLQYDTEASNTSSVGCKHISKKFLNNQKKNTNNAFADLKNDLNEIKDMLRNRNIDTIQAFGDTVVKTLREYSPQNTYALMAHIDKTMANFKSMVDEQQMNCLTPAPSIASPESVDYEMLRNQQNTTPFSYRWTHS